MAKTFFKPLILLSAFFLITASTSWALPLAEITYDITSRGGNDYTYEFTVTNTSTAPDTANLDFFQLFFDADDVTAYSNIAWRVDNLWLSFEDDWFDPGLGDPLEPGIAEADDAAIFGGLGGIAIGASLAFEVDFTYTGSLGVDEQLFSFYVEFGAFWLDPNDPNSDYDVAGFFEGTTVYGGGGAQVPEPATVLLFGLGLLGIAGVSRKKE